MNNSFSTLYSSMDVKVNTIFVNKCGGKLEVLVKNLSFSTQYLV